MAMKHLLSEEKQKEFRERSTFVRIDPSASEGEDLADAGLMPSFKDKMRRQITQMAMMALSKSGIQPKTDDGDKEKQQE